MNDQLKTQFSSKLTQLTRIIYLLNAKNEENELMLETIISNLEKEHNEKISKLYNKINSQINEFLINYNVLNSELDFQIFFYIIYK